MTETISSPHELLTFLVKAQGYHMSNIRCLVEKNGNTYTLLRGILSASVVPCPDLERFFIEVLTKVSPARDGQRSLLHLIELFTLLFPEVTADTQIVIQSLEAWAAALNPPNEVPSLQLVNDEWEVSFLFMTCQGDCHFMLPPSMAPEMIDIFGLHEFSYRRGVVAQRARSGKIDRLLAGEAS